MALSNPQTIIDEPIFSILTVTLNAAKHLPGLIESIRQQDYKGVEWIIVDGASTDETVNQIRGACDIVSFWVTEPDCGFYHALNKAISKARGKFYIVMGADDRFDEGAFDALRAGVFHAEESTGLIFYPVRRSGLIVYPHTPSYWRLLIGWSFIVASHSVGTLIRTTLHDDLGKYSLHYPLLADGHFLVKAFNTGVSIKLRGEIIGEFADGGMTSVDDARIAAETWLIQIKHGHGILLQTAYFLLRVSKLLAKSCLTWMK